MLLFQEIYCFIELEVFRYLFWEGFSPYIVTHFNFYIQNFKQGDFD